MHINYITRVKHPFLSMQAEPCRVLFFTNGQKFSLDKRSLHFISSIHESMDNHGSVAILAFMPGEYGSNGTKNF